MVVKNEPKGDKNAYKKRFKIDAEIQHEKRNSLEPSWGRLGPILGRFGIHLGGKHVFFLLENVIFREHRRFFKR